MSTQRIAEELLADVAGRVVLERIKAGHAGIRLQDVTPFAFEAFLLRLKEVDSVRVALAGLSGSEVKSLCKKIKYAEAIVTKDLAVAAKWRNDPNVKDPVVVVAFGEEERLGTFHRFTPVCDHNLYDAICLLAQEALCPNKVLWDWWGVLRLAEVRRLISVERLASYFLLLERRPKELPTASREDLYALGLLPSRELFDKASPSELLGKFRANRQLAGRIETLSNTDRDKLNRALESAPKTEREVLERTLGVVLKYNRTGSIDDLKALCAEDVRRLFESKTPGGKSNKGGQSAEAIAVGSVLSGDDSEVKELHERVLDALSAKDDDEYPSGSIPVSIDGKQVTLAVPPNLGALLYRAVKPNVFGGVFRSRSADSLERALDELELADFKEFSLAGENTFIGALKRNVEAGRLEPEVLAHWERFVDSRSKLAKEALALAVAPLVALVGDDDLLNAGIEYLDTYQQLLSILRDKYAILETDSPKGTRRMCARFLMLDTILIETSTGTHAILSPLQPLHLWKFIRLIQQVREQRATLTAHYRDVLAEDIMQLPHFVTALYVPESIVGERALILPQTRQLATLPCYQEDDPRSAGPEGQEQLLKVLAKFLVLYPHAREHLRICLVDPPMLPSLLEKIASQVINKELKINGLHVAAYRTLDRPLGLGADDDQLEAIAEVFADGDDQRFLVEVHPEQATYNDVLAAVKDSPLHVMVVFDPSKSEVATSIAQGAGFLHPLVLPKIFKYDPSEDELVITPAASGDLFDLFHNIQSRLNNSLTGAQIGISTCLGSGFPKADDILSGCTWLVIVDRLMSAHPVQGGQVISYEQGYRRDLVTLSRDFTKFERAFHYYLHRVNFDASEEAIRELITCSADLVGEGLLGLIRPDGD